MTAQPLPFSIGRQKTRGYVVEIRRFGDFLAAEKYARSACRRNGDSLTIQHAGSDLATCRKDALGRIWTDLTPNGAALI